MAIIDKVQALTRIKPLQGTVVLVKIEDQYADHPRIGYKVESFEASNEEMAYGILIEELAALEKSAKAGEAPASVGYILPTNVSIRLLEAQKLMDKEPDITVNNLKSRIVKDWIRKQSPKIVPYIESAVQALHRITKMNGGPSITIMKAVNLEYWELDAAMCDRAGIVDKQVLHFEESLDQQTGVTVLGYRHFSGEAEVTKRSFIRRDGTESGQYLIRRVPGDSETGLKNALEMEKVADKHLPRAKEANAEQAIAL